MNPVMFVSGPYRGKSLAEIEANVRDAARWCGVVKRLGWTPLCPHTNSHWIAEENLRDFGYMHESYLADALTLLHRCDAILMIEGWEQSDGALAERQYAMSHGIPVFGHREWKKKIPPAAEWPGWLFNWQRKRSQAAADKKLKGQAEPQEEEQGD